MNWDDFFIELARVYARKSKDPSTKVGAILVGPGNEQRSGGYNGLPRGVNDLPRERWEERPLKYAYCEHAERNAIFNAARSGTSTLGCTLYVAGGPPCADCARACIQAGICEVVCETTALGDLNERWRESVAIGRGMLIEAGVIIRVARLTRT